MFDEEIGKIFKFVDLELEKLEHNEPGLTVVSASLSPRCPPLLPLERKINSDDFDTVASHSLWRTWFLCVCPA
jgi:hypothetical protein